MNTEKTILEIIGTIEKKETLVSLGYDEMVLESLHPYPGYHGTTVPDNTDPKSAFLITKKNYTEEEIIRATSKAKKLCPVFFDGSPGEVDLFNSRSSCIRIKGLTNYKLIPEVLKAYHQAGIELAKGKTIKPYEGLIKIKKYFLLDELDNGIYLDRETPEMGYFEIPVELTFDQFEQITLDIKRNIKENKWDAALGILYRKTGLVDVIRIYDTNVCLGQCLFLHEKYTKEIDKLIKAQE
ncbi:MAG: hypothetical protein K9G58_02225 [Bacteroidales bacterium]|nr:hypothetical protein [Bacteroidales bacterium]MCF8388430.1 hypothetical protein [Bacteroidales bacterium]MCF8396953.1 hypothetical protein [Bacteroidales bacterium]